MASGATLASARGMLKRRYVGSAGPGPRRFGNPRTEEERKKRHQSLYGNTKLPPRGTAARLAEARRK